MNNFCDLFFFPPVFKNVSLRRFKFVFVRCTFNVNGSVIIICPFFYTICLLRRFFCRQINFQNEPITKFFSKSKNITTFFFTIRNEKTPIVYTKILIFFKNFLSKNAISDVEFLRQLRQKIASKWQLFYIFQSRNSNYVIFYYVIFVISFWHFWQ